MQNALKNQETETPRCRGIRKASTGTSITSHFEKALLNIPLDSHNHLERGDIYSIIPSIHRKMDRGLERRTDLPNGKQKY